MDCRTPTYENVHIQDIEDARKVLWSIVGGTRTVFYRGLSRNERSSIKAGDVYVLGERKNQEKGLAVQSLLSRFDIFSYLLTHSVIRK